MNKLVSKNPIERFKQGKKIIKAQQGETLPTAPKAENRYKYSFRSSEITPQGEKVKTVKIAPTRWKFPATIQERVNQQNDTTYIEVPTHTSILGGFIRPRVHARTVVKEANQPYNIGTYRTFTPSFVGPLFSPSNKQEYETLKRRFNTAWNLAK